MTLQQVQARLLRRRHVVRPRPEMIGGPLGAHGGLLGRMRSPHLLLLLPLSRLESGVRDRREMGR